jgi:hypothetical protein
MVTMCLTLIPALADEPTDQQTGKTTSALPATSAIVTVTIPADKSVQKLGDIKKIFVSPLGTGRGAELIRQKIINQLTESGHIVVVDSVDEADATFNGIARLHRYGLYDDLVTSGNAVVRLTGKDKQILWTDDANINKFPGYGSANRTSFKIADKLVKDLINAIELGKNKQ